MNNREAFEARMRKTSTSDLTINRFGNYRSTYVQNKWNDFQAGYQAALASQQQDHIVDGNEMAKHQPCGCVICTCEHETQCQGCGAKHCGTHAVGNIPNPVYLQSQAQQPAQEPSKSDLFKEKLQGVATTSPIPKDWELVSAPVFLNESAQEPVKRNPILLNSLAESTRCLGVAQVKHDKDAIEYWTKVVDDLVLSQEPLSTKTIELLKKAELEIDKHICTHEETHLDGAIWEICDSCGAKWADDEGGKPEFKPNKVSEEIREFLSTKPLLEPVKQESWISVEERLPEVKKGDYENVIVCKINPDGKKYVFEASYLNELELQFDESDEYRSFSGWHIQIERDGDDHFEGIQYGIVTHWMVKPLPPAPEGVDK